MKKEDEASEDMEGRVSEIKVKGKRAERDVLSEAEETGKMWGVDKKKEIRI